MSTVPTVSVLVTTYNHADYVEQALDSVLAQDTDDLEWVITDDASSDGTPDVITTWLERTGVVADLDLQPRNLGICATRNRALARSRAPLVCSLSGDDWYEPDRVRRQAEFLLSQDDDVAAVFSDVRVVTPDGTVRQPSYLADILGGREPEQGWLFRSLHRSNWLPAMGVMVRRSAIEAVGRYDESLAFEDWDMWLRLADRYRFAYLPMTAANRRELPTSLGHAGHRTPRVQRSVARINEKWLGRDEVARRQSAYWMRRAALVVADDDPREARAILERVRDVPAEDRVPWGLLGAAWALPGAKPVWARGRASVVRLAPRWQAERGAWQSGRRVPGIGQRDRAVSDSASSRRAP